jgi:hypothetical protein
MKHYKAPWSTSLVVLSTLGTLVCVGVALTLIVCGGGPMAWVALLPLAILFGSALFTIRGYSVGRDAILIHRLFWTTRLSLAGLESAAPEPDVMGWGFRTFGNGGLFSFTGFFCSSALGSYRAFVTDPHRTVVLHFPARIVVVSPSSPAEFAHDLSVTTPATA